MKRVNAWVALSVVAGGLIVGGAGTIASATAAPSCKSAQITVSRGATNGAAGTVYHAIVFTDIGGACALWGVPAIQPVAGANHAPVGPPAANASMGEMPVRHVLTTGKSVSVGYGVTETGNYSATSCKAKTASGVLVALLPFVRSTYVKMTISVCTARVSTHSQLIVPGRAG